jgi:flagellar hook-associated protein 2
MPAPIVMPSQSGIDVPSVINKLIELERSPLKRLEEDNKRNEIRIKAWEELRTRAKKLSDVSRDIYSFTGPFTQRKILSSDEGAITGTVSPNVDQINQKIQVLQLAKYHKIHSRKIHKDEKLPEATFSILVNQKEVQYNFKGGNIQNLEKLIRDKSNHIDVSMVQVDKEYFILTITSKISGSKGKLEFKDPNNLLKNLEIVGNVGKKEEKEEEIEFSPENFKENIEKIIINKNQFSFSELEKVSYDFSQKENITEIYLHWNLDIKTLQENTTNTKEKIYVGPEIKNQINGIELIAPQIERERITSQQEPANQDPERVGKIILYYLSSGTPKQKEIILNPKQRDFSFNFKEQENTSVQINAIEFSKNFEGIFTLTKLKVKKEIEDQTVFGPMHEIDPPQDALMLINGVQVSRSSNENLIDIIPGASLNLHRTTNYEVELKVEYDIQKIKDKIKEWVNQYNELLQFIKENDKFNRDQDFQVNRSSNPNERIEDGLRKLEDSSGIFAGDPIARRLVSTLARITGSAYPTKLNPSFKTLAQIGISTGQPGSNWQDIKQGLLILDEAQLENVLKNHPESVKELFALDKNEDAVVDDGVAYKMYEELSPYVKFSGGIITTRIALLKDQIKENKKIIYNKELSLGRKEEMLRKKFGNMESAIQNNKSMGKILQNKLGIKDE